MNVPRRLDSEICFHQLTASLEKLKNEQSSPEVVCGELQTFASLANKLDDIMRGEHRRLGLGELPIPPFEDWSPVTALVRDLRDITQHQWVVKAKLRGHTVFDASSVFGPRGPRLAIRWETPELDPLDRNAASTGGVQMGPAPAGGPLLGGFPAVQRRVSFVLVPPTPELAARLAKVGVDEIDTLCGLCLSVVKHRYDEFRGLIAKADLAKMKPLAFGGRRTRRRARAQPAPRRR